MLFLGNYLQMKTIDVVLLSALVLIAPVAWSHPDHHTLPGFKSMRMALPVPVEKSLAGTFNFGCTARACLELAAIGKVIVDAR